MSGNYCRKSNHHFTAVQLGMHQSNHGHLQHGCWINLNDGFNVG